MLSAAELASIQASAYAATCDKPCQIWRATSSTPDGVGTRQPTYTKIAPTGSNTLLCGIAEPSGNELANFDFLIGAKIAVKVHLPIGTDVQVADHLVVEGQTFEVHVPLTPRSYPSLLSIICAEIK